MREVIASHLGLVMVYYDESSIMDDIASLQNMLNDVRSGKAKFPMLDFEANTHVPEAESAKYIVQLAKDLKRRKFKE